MSLFLYIKKKLPEIFQYIVKKNVEKLIKFELNFEQLSPYIHQVRNLL